MYHNMYICVCVCVCASTFCSFFLAAWSSRNWSQLFFFSSYFSSCAMPCLCSLMSWRRRDSSWALYLRQLLCISFSKRLQLQTKTKTNIIDYLCIYRYHVVLFRMCCTYRIIRSYSFLVLYKRPALMRFISSCCITHTHTPQ